MLRQRAALKDLQKITLESYLSLEYHNTLNSLFKKWVVEFFWVSNYTGIRGNEIASEEGNYLFIDIATFLTVEGEKKTKTRRI